MVEPQLVDYIKKASMAGQSNEQTRALLYKNGWTESEVSEAFASISQPSPTQEQPKPQMQPQAQPQTQAKPQVQPQTQQQPQVQISRRSSPVLKFIVVLVLLVVISGVGYFVATQTDLLKNIIPIQVKNDHDAANVATSFSQPSFAQYKLETTKYTPAVPEYSLALTDITNLANFQNTVGNFSLSAKNALVADNFFIARNNDKFYNSNADAEYANRNDDWTYLYGKIGGPYAVYARQPENSVFITSDFLTHTYHKLISNEFSYIEEANFYPTLKTLSKALLTKSAGAYNNASDPAQKDSYERLSAYFLVTSAILDNATADYEKFKAQNFVDDSQSDTKSSVLASLSVLAKQNNASTTAENIASQEINLIFDANKMVSSPLMGEFQPGMSEDYTQFGPRSHYTKNVILRDYFRAMMFYGRMNFLLSSKELTRDAANLTALMSEDQIKQWESIYKPTTFFVGQSDDLSVYEFGQAEKKTKFNSSSAGEDVITKLQNELLTYKNPQIMSSVIVSLSVPDTTKEDLQNTTKGFRFMGQRFTPDAFIFSTLTQGDEKPDPKTGQKLPSMPTALMVSTLMGSQESATLLDTWIKDNAPNSDKVLADKMTILQNYFDKTTEQQWTQNIYWSWLSTIKSLFNISDTSGYPMFVKSENWGKKVLQAFLGSWTELKHDTLLYAKQSYAELGAGGDDLPPLPVPKGYVEPNIEFFDRLIALVNLTNDGLKQFGVLPPNFEAQNNTFLDTLKFYRTIAVAELQNQVISDENFEKLRVSAGQLDYILKAPDSGVQLEKNARSAIIADVHTDAVDSQILYVADGVPNYIYVAVKDANGTRLTKGLVYSYYEFTGPVGKRYTDQVWQGWNYSSTVQKLQMPWWSKDLAK